MEREAGGPGPGSGSKNVIKAFDIIVSLYFTESDGPADVSSTISRSCLKRQVAIAVFKAYYGEGVYRCLSLTVGSV